MRDDATRIVTVINEQRRVGQDSMQLQAFERLFSLALIMLYNGESDAAGMLEDLTSCYDTNIMLKEGSQGGSAGESGDTIVELLLGFLSKPSANLRRLAQQTFAAFVPKLTVEGLQILLDVLESSENLQGQQALFDKEEVENEDDDVDVEDADAEMIDADEMDGIVINGGEA